jgi:hypothetical protein
MIVITVSDTVLLMVVILACKVLTENLSFIHIAMHLLIEKPKTGTRKV